MRNLRVLFIVIVLCILISGAFAFDTSFYFFPESGTKMKLYCETSVYMMINWWSEKFNWFQASISFDSDNITVNKWIINSDFPNWSDESNISWNLYNVWWAMLGWYKEGVLTWVSFSIITKENITWTTLSFVDKFWNPPSFWLMTTDDNISLDSPDYNWDILSNVSPVTYDFVALPCVPDWDQPRIENVSVANWATKISENQTITFLTYDWNGSSNSKVTRWFAWNSTWNIANYVSAPNNVDNQEWVNSWSISVKLSCAGCSGSPSNVSPDTLNISDWIWTTSMNALTWDSERRWYNVSFTPPFPYEVEKQVTVNISVTDNPNEFGETHTKSQNFYFNNAVAPNITRISPTTDTFVSPSKNFPISFYISDDWAGVDTSSVAIKVSYSGEEFIYSWSDLDFELSWWSEWLWYAWSYRVTFYPKEDFPVLTQINLHVTWYDLAWSVKTLQSSFTTRPDCSFFGCIDSVTIIWDNINQIFSWTVLSITWTNPNSPYPYLTWENSEILMCGKDWSGTNILGSVYLYDMSWNKLNNVWYTWNELFITWLDIVYQDGVIIVE